jgi:hypothetical protein
VYLLLLLMLKKHFYCISFVGNKNGFKNTV